MTASIFHVEGGARASGVLTEGDEVNIQFNITDASTGIPLQGAFPAAWLDLANAGGPQDDTPQCQRRVRRLLGGGLFSRSELDLNVYYVLALNADASISVVDPLFGFGGSKLLALIDLLSPGEDWVITDNQDKLFVSMPDAGRVATIDTRNWTVTQNLEVGEKPTRLAMQPDGAYLWAAVEAGDDKGAGVSVIRVHDQKVVAQIETGAGPHDIAFSPDSRYTFVTNRDAGSMSVIDIPSLQKIKDLEVGDAPVSVAFAAAADTVYVASETDGVITAVQGHRLEQITQMQVEPGIVQVRIAPDGRTGFAPNPRRDTINVIDTASNRVVQTAVVLDGPDQITFTNELAYVRHRDSEVVLMIPLAEIGTAGRDVPVIDFSGGQHPLGLTSRPSLADAIVQASGAYAVLVANPADEAIYYYKEGMAAPMGSFSNYGREPRAAITVERNLRERSPGVYETTVQLTRAGDYHLAFFLNSPRIIHCFELKVLVDQTKIVASTGPRIEVETLSGMQYFEVGKPRTISFRLNDIETGTTVADVADLSILVFSPIWQRRVPAQYQGNGVYSAEISIPVGGFFRVLTAAPSMQYPYTEQFTLSDTGGVIQN